jgi:hypothetical protein
MEICTLLRYGAAYGANFLLTFQDNQSVPSSRVNIPRLLKIGPMGYFETSVGN